MGKFLIPEKGGYKANLHCHSTDSDGTLSPEELKKYYMEHGYSVLAYTDHFYMRDRTYLNDENFVAISGYENNIIQPDKNFRSKLYHLNFYSPSPEKVGMVGVCRDEYEFWMRNKSQEEKEKSPLLKGFCSDEYSIENINRILNDAKEAGYLVILNHPVWSNQDCRDLVGLKGLCGVEVVNYGCVTEGYDEDNGYLYDAMLRDGQKISCFANDDNHNLPNVMSDSFGGYNIIYPKKLTYKDVFNAIKNGDNYASSGACFHSLYVDDGKIYVSTENARVIRMTTEGRGNKAFFASDSPLTEAVFNIPDGIRYFRITIEDIFGKKAYSRAYFSDEWQ